MLLLFSKSRTAFLFIGMLGVIYLLLEKRDCRKVLGRILLVGGLILAAFWLVMNIEPLYKLVGYRLTGAVSFLTNDGNVDASVRERNKMISAGLDMFIKHPLLGVGARNYSNIAFAKYGIWADVYAHSNLIEILADFGLIGTLLYYIPRIWCLVRLFRLRKRITDPQRLKCCAFLTAFVITNLITDYIYISFNNEAIQLVYTLCFAFACFGGETAEERRAPVIPLKTWEGRKKHEQKVFPAGAAG